MLVSVDHCEAEFGDSQVFLILYYSTFACCEKEVDLNSEIINMVDAKVTRFPLLSSVLLLVITFPLRGLFTFVRNDA